MIQMSQHESNNLVSSKKAVNADLEGKVLPVTLYDVVQTFVGDKLTKIEVQPITVTRFGVDLLAGATAPSITFIAHDGITCRGSVDMFYFDESEAQKEAASLMGFVHQEKQGAQLEISVKVGVNYEIGKHDWCVSERTADGYLVYVDDRPVSYRHSLDAARRLALDVIDRCFADGDYRLNDKPAGFMPPAIPDQKSLNAAAPTNVRMTVIQFTVLHDDGKDLSSMSLEEIGYECREGGYIGGELVVISNELLTREMVDAQATRLGSDASFFDIDVDESDSNSTREQQ